MVREQDILCALGPAVDFALERNQRPQRKLMAAAVGAAAFLVGYLPQLIAYQALNGFPRPSPLVTRKMFWYSPHALQVLLDPEHGFFFWTPLALLAVAGLILLVAVARSACLAWQGVACWTCSACYRSRYPGW